MTKPKSTATTCAVCGTNLVDGACPDCAPQDTKAEAKTDEPAKEPAGDVDTSAKPHGHGHSHDDGGDESAGVTKRKKH